MRRRGWKERAKEGKEKEGEEDERKGREEGTAHLYPSKKARALLKVGVGMPRVTAVATTLRQEPCTVE